MKNRRTAPVGPVPCVVTPAVPEALHPLQPSAGRVDGWLGARIDVNERNRLLGWTPSPDWIHPSAVE